MEKIERIISVFKKEDESLVDEINVDHLSLDDLRRIFNPAPDDINLIYVYPIGPNEASQLKKIINIDFNFDDYIYQLDCFAKVK